MSDRYEFPSSVARGLAELGFMGPPPIADGEVCESYDELAMRVTGAINPADVIEDMLVRDIVDLTWDVLRLRRFKADLLTACTRSGVGSELWFALDSDDAKELERKWAVHDESARVTVNATLASKGLTVQGVTARVVARDIQQFERLERLINAAESRRSAALRQLDVHRATLSRRQRRALSNVEDAEFQTMLRKTTAEKAGG